MDAQGRVFTGCNVENVSYPVTLCAERVAVGAMVAAGSRQLHSVAVATKDGGTPCGMCLQVLLEFAPDPSAVTVAVVGETGDIQTFTLSELIPHGFASASVRDPSS
jgi:cytidine deaminase